MYNRSELDQYQPEAIEIDTMMYVTLVANTGTIILVPYLEVGKSLELISRSGTHSFMYGCSNIRWVGETWFHDRARIVVLAMATRWHFPFRLTFGILHSLSVLLVKYTRMVESCENIFSKIHVLPINPPITRHNAIMTLLLHQNDVASLFWCTDDVIIALFVCWENCVITGPECVEVRVSKQHYN